MSKLSLNTAKIRQDFPMYSSEHRGPFVYLDSASSSQTPRPVLDAVNAYYETYRANVHRGMYQASETATKEYEAVRRMVADFIFAKEDEIIFTRGTTESLNIVANGFVERLEAGDEIVLTVMEHHANLVPWQQVAKKTGCILRFIPLRTDYTIDIDAARRLIGPKTKILAVTLASNVLGTIVPAAELAKLAHAHSAVVVVDAAQAIGHIPVDVRKLDCDFLAFSGHKMYGPTGTGVLYGKKSMLQTLDPLLFGGDMIRDVSFENATWNDVPWKFEAGTPHIGGVIGLGAAVRYVQEIGVQSIAAHEAQLTAYALQKLAEIPGVTIIGPNVTKERIGVVSFDVAGMHPHDLATILDADGVCVRGGHHCAMPLLRSLGHMNGTTRLSLSIINDEKDIEALVAGILKAKKIFRI